MDQTDHASRKRIRLIGLTGSLAAGKTTAAMILKDRGFRVVDADGLAREILLEDGVRDQIRSRFGDNCYHADGSPDRKRIAEVVFSNQENREWLNSLVHPMVRQRVRDLAAAGLLVYDVPLLFESGAHRETDLTIMIDAPVEERITRAEQRNGWSREEFLARESAQMPPEQKRLLADFVIDNDGDLESLRESLDRLIEKINKRIDP